MSSFIRACYNTSYNNWSPNPGINVGTCSCHTEAIKKSRQQGLISEQNNIDNLIVSDKLETLAAEMNTHIDTQHFIDILVGNEYFQQWYLLSVDVPDHMKWLDELLSVNETEIDKACRGILLTLF